MWCICYATRLLSVCLSVLSVCDVGALWPNGCMDQDETWHAGRPHLWPDCIRWRLRSHSPKGAQPPNFRPISVVAKLMDATWYGGRPQLKRHWVRWGPSSPYPKRGHSPQFLAHVYCGQMAGWIKMPFGTEVGLVPRHTVYGDPAPLKKGRHSLPIFGPCLLWPNARSSELLLSTCLFSYPLSLFCYFCRPFSFYRNGPTPFPGQMSEEVTEPGFSFLCWFCVICIIYGRPME